MKRLILVLLPTLLALPACETAHQAAVSTFRVVDAPAAYVRRRLDVDGQTTTTTTETTYSDTAGYPPQQPYPAQPQPYQERIQPPPPPVQTQRRVVTEDRTRERPPEPEPTATPRITRRENNPPPSRTTESEPDSQRSELPYAKPVPGKPGFVFSPYDKNGGYVDVKGYNPGQKVKDPYSGKIFLVP
ncbi:MAG: hypothetical protein ABI787_01800 [Spartobacteria bacterium]